VHYESGISVLLNPWENLPSHANFVLAEDAAAVCAFNESAAPAVRFDLSLFPEPYFGRRDAPIVLLTLNPGGGPRDPETHANPAFSSAARASLVHALNPVAFLHLQQPASTPGGAWWRRIAKPLIEATDLEAVARSMLCVQYVGYHSERFGSRSLRLPSQAYGFELVRSAIRRHAIVVCMRSWHLWSAAVPELTTYAPVYKVRNVRNPVISPANLPDGYNALLEAMVRST